MGVSSSVRAAVSGAGLGPGKAGLAERTGRTLHAADSQALSRVFYAMTKSVRRCFWGAARRGEGGSAVGSGDWLHPQRRQGRSPQL